MSAGPTQKKIQFNHAASAVNSPKSELIWIARRIEEISPRKAESLRNIIARLEDWQNRF